MDLQVSVVERIAVPIDYLGHLSRTLTTARAARIPVLYVVARFRSNAPEANVKNLSFKRNPTAAGFIENTPGAAIHPALTPQLSDIVVTKRRVSAFTGSDLEVVLRSLGVTHIILTGMATSGVVLSTIREAADMDYEITVLEDLCLDPDPEVHAVLMNKVFVKQGKVVCAEEWTSKLTIEPEASLSTS